MLCREHGYITMPFMKHWVIIKNSLSLLYTMCMTRLNQYMNIYSIIYSMNVFLILIPFHMKYHKIQNMHISCQRIEPEFLWFSRGFRSCV